MNFSNWAIIGQKDHTCFGKLAKDVRDVLGVKYLLAFPSERMTDKKLEENDIFLSPEFSKEEVKKVIKDLDGIIFMERHGWHKDFLDITKEMNIKTICVLNWEWFNGKNEKWKLVDWFVCPNVHTLNIVKNFGFVNVTHLAWPLDIGSLPKREVKGPARHFVYNGGIVNEDDRKALKETLRAFRMVKDPGISLTIRLQKDIKDYKPLLLLKRVYYKYFLRWTLDQRWKAAKELKRSLARDKRITLKVGSLEDPADLYKEGDVIIYASKLEGACLGVMEAVACGMPVITTNDPPMNEYVKQKEMLVKTKWLKRKALPNRFGCQTILVEQRPPVNTLVA